MAQHIEYNHAVRLFIVVIVIAAACKRDHPCEKLVDLVEKCSPLVPGDTLQEMQLMCSSELRGEPRPSAFRECSAATTCADQTACFDRWDCRYFFTDVNDQTPQFMCALTPP